MANNGENITTKFKVDISDLKAGISEANKQIKLANAEFKAASAGMDDWAKSADGINAKLSQLDKVLVAQKSKLSDYREQLQRIENASEENQKRANELKAKLQELADQGVSKTSAEYKAYQKALTECEKEQVANQKAADSLRITILNQEAAVNGTEKEIRNYKTSLDNLDEAQEELADSADEVSDGFTVMKGALASLVADGIRKAISAVQDFIAESIEVGKQFDKSMSNVAALSGATGDELKLLRDTAKEFGSTTQFSASQSADALGYMALAGWDANQSVDALGGVLNLAASSGMELAHASDMVTDYMSAFGMEADQSAYFADLLAYAQANANTTAQGLGDAFKNTAANMNAAGQDIETVTSLLSMMANQGLKGSEAGTALTAIMRDMTAKMEDGAIAIGNTTVKVMDAEGNYRDLTDILMDVEAATNGMGDAQKATALASTFTSDSIKGLNLILNAGVSNAADFEKELRNSSGAAEEMAKVMNDNLSGDLVALGSQFEGVQIAMYEKFEPALRKGVTILSKMLDGLSWVIDHSEQLTTAIEVTAAAVGTFLVVMNWGTIMTAAATMLGKVRTAMIALNATIAANPVALLAAAIAALIVVGAKFIKHLMDEEKAIKSTQQAQEDLTAAKQAAEEAENTYVNAVDRATAAQKALEEAEKQSGITGEELYKKVQDGTLDYANMTDQQKEVYKAYMENDAAQKAVKESTEALTEAKKQETIASFENDLAIAKETGSYDEYKASVIDAYNKGILSAEEARDLIGAAMSEMSRDSQQTFMEDIPSDITEGLEPTQYETKGQQLTKWFGEKWQDIKDIFINAPTWFSERFGEAWENIKEKFRGWGTYWSGLWQQVKEKFTGLGTRIGEGISGAVKAGINKIISGIEGRINTAIGLINGAIDLINKLPGVQVGKVKKVSFPRLAKGGVLAKGQVGLLEGSGAEAVVPLERNKAWIRAVAQDMKKELQNQMASNSTSNLSNSNVNNFTQIINAPKQPSRIELYRQTRNLLAYAGLEGGM